MTKTEEQEKVVEQELSTYSVMIVREYMELNLEILSQQKEARTQRLKKVRPKCFPASLDCLQELTIVNPKRPFKKFININNEVVMMKHPYIDFLEI